MIVNEFTTTTIRAAHTPRRSQESRSHLKPRLRSTRIDINSRQGIASHRQPSSAGYITNIGWRGRLRNCRRNICGPHRSAISASTPIWSAWLMGRVSIRRNIRSARICVGVPTAWSMNLSIGLCGRRAACSCCAAAELIARHKSRPIACRVPQYYCDMSSATTEMVPGARLYGNNPAGGIRKMTYTESTRWGLYSSRVIVPAYVSIFQLRAVPDTLAAALLVR